MKQNLRFGCATLVMLLFALQLSAQRPGGGRGFQMSEEDIRERVENTSKTLELNDNQHQQILKYELDFYNKMQIERQKMRNSGGQFDREEMREKMMNIRDERNTKYEEVLSPEQYKKFTEIQEQRRSEMRQQRESGGQPAQRPARGRGRG